MAFIALVKLLYDLGWEMLVSDELLPYMSGSEQHPKPRRVSRAREGDVVHSYSFYHSSDREIEKIPIVEVYTEIGETDLESLRNAKVVDIHFFEGGFYLSDEVEYHQAMGETAMKLYNAVIKMTKEE